MKSTYAIFIIIIILTGSCQQNNNSTEEIIATVKSEPIYLSEVDKNLQQFIYEKLNEIYFAREKSLNSLINKKAITIYCKDNNIQQSNLINYIYSKKQIEHLKKSFIYKNHLNEGVPNIGRSFSVDKFHSEIGNGRIDEMFRTSITRHISDSILRTYKTSINLTRPPIPKLLLSDLNIYYLDGRKFRNKFILFTDPDCSNCSDFFSIFEALMIKHEKSTNFGIVLYSSSTNDNIRLLSGAAKQNKLLCAYKYINNVKINKDRTVNIDTLCKVCSLDITKLSKDISSYSIVKENQDNFTVCQKIGITQTPSIVYNRSLLSNLLDLKSLDQIIMQGELK